MRIKNILLIVLLSIVALEASSAQIKSNLEIISRLIDSSVVKIIRDNNQIKAGFYLKNNLPQNYNSLNNQIFTAFINNKIQVFNNPDNSYPELNYTITSISVNYSDLFKDGFLGSYKLTREIVYLGNYTCTTSGKNISADHFRFTNKDSVDYEMINDIESPGLNYTRGTKPDEPMFSSLLEPAIAVCTAAVVIYLFFTVRSK